MKRPINILLLLLFCGMVSAYAQTNMGDRLIGGSASIGFIDNTNISISPNMGWFLKDDFALGAYFNYNFSKSGSYTYQGVSVGPFVRYYFNGEGNLRVFTFGSVGYSFRHNKFDEEKENYSSFNVSAGFGASYFITQQVAFEARAGYHVSNISSDFETNHGLEIDFGFQIHLLKQD